MNTKKFGLKKSRKPATLSMLGLGLAACGGSEGERSSDPNDENVVIDPNDETVSSFTGLKPVELSGLWNFQSQKYVPYGGNTVASKIETIEGQPYYFTNLMFDVPADAGDEIPNQSNLLVFKINDDGLKIYDQKIIDGSTLMYFGDVNGDGNSELVMTLAGEDGRTMNTSADGAKQILIYDVGEKSVSYVGDHTWSHGGGVFDLNYDGKAEIIDTFFHDPASVIYSTPDFSKLATNTIFQATPGMTAFDVLDIDSDGYLEVVQRFENTHLDGDGSIVLKIYEIAENLVFNLEQEVVIGNFSKTVVENYLPWNGNPENPESRNLGELMGETFGEYQSWFTKFADIDNDGHTDIFEIYSLNDIELNSDGFNVMGDMKVVCVTYFGTDGTFNAENAKVLNLPFSSSHHTNNLIDLDLDGDLDIYFGVTDQKDGVGYSLNDRIYLNDGDGNFAKLSDDYDLSFADNDNTMNGEYVATELDGETYLIGLTSDVNGGDLSTAIIPVSSVIA